MVAGLTSPALPMVASLTCLLCFISAGSFGNWFREKKWEPREVTRTRDRIKQARSETKRA
jgi:hypothetical protein